MDKATAEIAGAELTQLKEMELGMQGFLMTCCPVDLRRSLRAGRSRRVGWNLGICGRWSETTFASARGSSSAWFFGGS